MEIPMPPRLDRSHPTEGKATTRPRSRGY